MNFELRYGLIFVPVRIFYDGSYIQMNNCILDTGSATTALDIDSVTLNYQKPTTIRRLRGIGGGREEVACQTIEQFILDDYKFFDIEIEFGDFQCDFGIQGFIGTNILCYFKTTIDFSKRSVIFEKQATTKC